MKFITSNSTRKTLKFKGIDDPVDSRFIDLARRFERSSSTPTAFVPRPACASKIRELNPEYLITVPNTSTCVCVQSDACLKFRFLGPRKVLRESSQSSSCSRALRCSAALHCPFMAALPQRQEKTEARKKHSEGRPLQWPAGQRLKQSFAFVRACERILLDRARRSGGILVLISPYLCIIHNGAPFLP